MPSRQKIVVIGAGGHARVILALIEALGKYEIVGLLDRGNPDYDEKISGYSIVGEWSDLGRIFKQGVRQAALAIGNNKERADLYFAVKKQNMTMPALIHPKASLDRSCQINEAAVICMGAMIGPQVKIGSGVIINTGSIIDHETVVGDFSHIAPGVSMAGRVSIGEGVFIGIGTSIIDKVEVGAWTQVGAGSVVVGNLPSQVKAYGVPAKIAGQE